MKIKLSVLGVRGGLPAPDRQFMEYGGNTSCVSMEYRDDIVCFDAGSGLLNLDHSALARAKRLHILISHVHIDHIMGLYQLSAFSVPEIHLYGEAGEGGSFSKRLETAIGRPYWPLGLRTMGQIRLHELGKGEEFALPGDSGFRVSTMAGNHPGGSLLYRAEREGVRITYVLDCEMEEAVFSGLAAFAAGSDLLIWDANFTNADKQVGWGHSTWEEGLAFGQAAGTKRILMTHYARDYTDSFLQEQELLARKGNNACMFAREGMVIEL